MIVSTRASFCLKEREDHKIMQRLKMMTFIVQISVEYMCISWHRHVECIRTLNDLRFIQQAITLSNLHQMERQMKEHP